MGRRGVETIYFGKRPNVIRVYNKVAERQYQYSRMLARAKRNNIPVTELQTFEQIYGHSPTGCVLTRVERQIAGGRIPEQIGTFGAPAVRAGRLTRLHIHHGALDVFRRHHGSAFVADEPALHLR